MGLCIPPGVLSLGQLLFQDVDSATGIVQAGLKSVSLAAGLLQLPSDSVQLGPQGLLSPLTLTEMLLKLLYPGLPCCLYFGQLTL